MRLIRQSGNMQKKDNKPITKNTLISMQVIDSKGQLLGKVKDVVFEVGKAGNSLLVENESGETQTVRWEDVQGCTDFCVLKPTAQPSVQLQQPLKLLNLPLPRRKQVRRYVLHAVSLLLGFRNIIDGTAITIRNTFSNHPCLFFYAHCWLSYRQLMVSQC